MTLKFSRVPEIADTCACNISSSLSAAVRELSTVH